MVLKAVTTWRDVMQKRRSRKLGLALGLLGLVLFAAQGLYAQVDTGGITGTVKDASGAVIPGAKVTLTNEGTSFSVSTVTDSAGAYTFTPVKIGSYKVTAEFQGFQTSAHPGVTVDVQQTVVVDFSSSARPSDANCRGNCRGSFIADPERFGGPSGER